MIDENEIKAEKQNLNNVCKVVEHHIKVCENAITKFDKNYQDLYDYISENYPSFDEEEKATQLTLLNQSGANCNDLYERQRKLLYCLDSPYFGAFFKKDGKTEKCLVGISNIFNKDNTYPIVIDWRAPICALFYESKLGKIEVEIDNKIIEVEVTEKRSYKIKNRELIDVYETTSATSDEMLEEILSSSTSSKMRNIVSSIQDEQNSIIRNDKVDTILVQGVAGSGKSSIALHRVAYLLYKYRDTLKSQDFCLISPNNIFSDYVSNVLPELGEENVLEMCFEDLAKEEFKSINLKIETRADMLEMIIADKTRRDEVLAKSTFEFYEDLKKYLNENIGISFKPADMVFDGQKVKKETLLMLFNEKYKAQIPSVRLLWISDFLMEQWNLNQAVAERLKKMLYNMIDNCNIESVYNNFLNTIGMNYEKISNKGKYEDLAPLLIVKEYLLGIEPDAKVKYLLIDEMQDYTPCHFHYFQKKYSCKKIILGDIYQAIEKHLQPGYIRELAKMFDKIQIMNLNKCYRSSKQIGEMAQTIYGRQMFECVNRKGKEVEILEKEDEIEALTALKNICKKWLSSNFIRCAIITKTQAQAKELFAKLGELDEIQLLEKNSDAKIQIVSSTESKGLEFDGVLVFDASNKNFCTELDRNLLYISATRALHELYFLSTGKCSKFLSKTL